MNPKRISFWTNRSITTFGYTMDETEILTNPNFSVKLFEIDLNSYYKDEGGMVKGEMNLEQFSERALKIPLKPIVFHDLFVEWGRHFLPKFEFHTINNEKDILLPA